MNENIKTPFYNAIRKYGDQMWTLEILSICETAEQAKEKEKFFIKLYDSYNNGYNATLGGDGNNGIIMSEESNKKRSVALKGKPKNYIRMLGKKHSNDTLQKMRKPKKDKSRYQTEEFKNLMRIKQAAAAKQKRAMTKDQYEKMKDLISSGLSKKKVSDTLGLSYDIVKKWSNLQWE